MKALKINRKNKILNCLIDNDDFNKVSKYKWYVSNWGYVIALPYNKNTQENEKCILLHRLIMNCPENMTIDHIDHNRLNNQKSNLRICTRTENNRNMSAHNKSGLLGVYNSYRTNQPYRAMIKINKTNIFLGRFKTKEEAGLAYNKKAIELFGEFANLNKIGGKI